jgi:uncharacterized protein involved in tolerance to divalent cations
MKNIIWILINCNNLKEADKIGKSLLKKRLISCFDIFSRLKTSYFWPPKTGKIKSGKGAMLITETLSKNFSRVYKVTKLIHSDKLPFIGAIKVSVSDEYYDWVKSEIV